jgi:hypothetical protein
MFYFVIIASPGSWRWIDLKIFSQSGSWRKIYLESVLQEFGLHVVDESGWRLPAVHHAGQAVPQQLKYCRTLVCVSCFNQEHPTPPPQEYLRTTTILILYPSSVQSTQAEITTWPPSSTPSYWRKNERQKIAKLLALYSIGKMLVIFGCLKNQCCGSGSGLSRFRMFLSSRILIRNHLSGLWIRIRIRILPSPIINSKKNLDSYFFVTSFWLFTSEKWCT